MYAVRKKNIFESYSCSWMFLMDWMRKTYSKASLPRKVSHKIMTSIMRPPLNSAEFNVREIAKQLLLLEDHLSDDEKYCTDCIRKHLMTAEALAEEAVAMDPKSKWLRDAKYLAKQTRNWMVDFIQGKNRVILSQEIRVVRKKLIDKVHDPRI